MKTNGKAINGGFISDEYKTLWAKYYCRYIQEMEKEGIEIFAISVQNEPNAIQSWESCQYDAQQEAEFIEHHLAPALDEAGLSHIKLIIWDHNKERVYDRAKKIFTSKAVEDRVWAVGHHWYSGDHFDGLRLVHERYNKKLISSEICGVITDDALMVAENYARELCGDFNNYTSAFCDWNILLNEWGGPFHNRCRQPDANEQLVYENKGIGCYAPILYHTEEKKLIYTPIFYYVGHFSKFVKRGAHRIATTKYSDMIQACAFENPDGSLVLILANISDSSLPANVRHNDVCTGFTMPAHSIATVLL